MTSSLPSFRRKLESTSSPRCPFARELPWMPPPPPVIPAKAGIHVASPESAWPGVGVDDGIPPVFPAKAGIHVPSPESACPRVAIDTAPPRHSGESRKPRTPTLRDSPLTPDDGQPLRQPKRGRDVDPGFRRGDGVGSSGHLSSQTEGGSNPPTRHLAHPPSAIPPPLPSFRRKPESTHPNPQGQPVNSTMRSTTETAEAWKERGPRLSPGRRSRAIGASFVSNGGRKQPPNPSSRPPLPSFRREAGIHGVGRPPGLRSPAKLPKTPPPHPSFRRKPEPTHPNPQGQPVKLHTAVNH